MSLPWLDPPTPKAAWLKFVSPTNLTLLPLWSIGKSEWYPGDNGCVCVCARPCVCVRLHVCLNENHWRLLELIPFASAGLWQQSGGDMAWDSTLFSQGQSKPRYHMQEYDYMKLCIWKMRHYSHPDGNCVMQIHRFLMVLLTISAP